MSSFGDESIKPAAIIWRGIQLPGHEACQMFFLARQWHLEGTAVFTYEHASCLLSYNIRCDSHWHTKSAKVEGWVGDRVIQMRIKADSFQHWWKNDVEVPAVAGCLDLDLNFSPSTNTIAIRRLKLAVGQEMEITAAWLRFPGFTLEPLVQAYTRLDENHYRYKSGDRRFVAELEIDQASFVIDYPGIWKKEI